MTSNQPLTLMNIPLEVRHKIFEHVAKRDTKPEKLLRYWFEKKEVREKTAELVAKNPNVGKPRVVYEGDQFEVEEQEENSEEEGDGKEDSDQEDGDEDEDDEEEEVDDDDGDEAEEQDEEMADDNSTAIAAAAASIVPADAQESTAADITTQQATTQEQQDPAVAVADQTAESTVPDRSSTGSMPGLGAAMAEANKMVMTGAGISPVAATEPNSFAAPLQSQDGARSKDADADMTEADEEDADTEDSAAEQEDARVDDKGEDEENNGNQGANSESDEDTEDEDEDEDISAGAAPPAPVITTHRKWRHIPKFMLMTHCPPPVELLLTSKQLNAEAKNWFYDVAVLHIEATGSFAHTSFFEEAFSQITEAAFSPIEDIRRVEVTFVWDSTWLRSDRAGCAGAIFPALLRQRAIFVTGILAQAPNLSQVTIHWHDSAEDEEAVDLMNDVLVGFLGLDATVKVEPHYIAVDAKPYRKSIAGKQRVEFQRIMNNGLDRLF